MSLVIVGSLAFDTIETPTERRERIVGGSGTYCALAASFFTRPRVVGVIGRDFPKSTLAFLRSRKIDLEGVEVRKGKTFHWGRPLRGGLQPEDDGPDGPQCLRRFQAPPPALVPLRGHPLSGQYRPGPPRPRPCPGKEAAARGHGYDPVLDRDEAEAVVRELGRVDIYFANDEEVKLLAGDSNLVRAGKKLLKYGPSLVVAKKGEHGALCSAGTTSSASSPGPAMRSSTRPGPATASPAVSSGTSTGSPGRTGGSSGGRRSSERRRFVRHRGFRRRPVPDAQAGRRSTPAIGNSASSCPSE